MGPHRPDPPSTILLAHDGTPGAERAAARAAHLPLADGAVVHLVEVAPPYATTTASQEEALRRRAAAMRDALAACGRGDVQVAPALLEGQPPYEELVRHARVHGAELIVLGRHGDGAPDEPSMGSTALQLLRHGDVPLLIVVKSDRPTRPFERPVVAVDLTDASRQVVELALALVAGSTTPLTVVHTAHVPFQGAFAWTLNEAATAQAREETLRAARSRAERFVETLGPLGTSAQVAIAEGEPSLGIVREVVRRAADLVVVGTHGRSGLSHAIFGSVAEWIVASAPCDVAVTRPTRHTFELP